MVAPWPRISTTDLSPSEAASALPSGAVRISMSVMPPASRISKIGTPQPRKPHMWNIGRSLAPLAVPNGMSGRAWQCTTEITSGRTL